MPDTSNPDIKLFYCYARKDKALRDELEIHLSGLKRQYRLTNWSDREILPGEQWEQAIDTHLNTADVILLLISPHFLASDYCYGKEMQRALERHRSNACRVIPILLRPTHWEGTPLNAIQMLPTGARPITRWRDRDEAFHNVAEGIGAAIKALLIERLHRTKEKLKSSPIELMGKGWELKGKGWTFYQHRQFKEALAAYEQAIQINPNDVYAYTYKGDTLSRFKRYEEALATYNQAIQADPSYTRAYVRKGQALNELKRYEEALAVYDQAIQVDPNYERAYDLKSKMLIDLKRYNEALTTIDQAFQINLNDSEILTYRRRYLEIGVALNELKRHEEALAVFDQAIQVDPSVTFAYENKGDILNELKRYEEAQTAYDQAIQVDPSNASAYYGKGTVLQNMGRHKEAQQAFDKARELGYES